MVHGVDRQGREAWSHTYGGERDEIANAIILAPDGGFIISGTTATFGGGNTDTYLVRTNAEGQSLWTKSYSAKGPAGHGFDWCTAMGSRKRGGNLITGYADCNDLMEAVVTCINDEGEEVWSRAFGDSFYDYGAAGCEMRDQSLIAAGTTKTPAGNNDFTVSKLDAQGQLLWRKVVGGPGQEWSTDVTETENGDYLVIGHTNSAGAGSFGICLCLVAGQ